MNRFKLLTVVLAAGTLASPLPARTAYSPQPFEKLRVERFIMPEFPEHLRRTGVSHGVVTVIIGRDTEGRVNDILVLDSSHAKFTQSVVKAVSAWRFAFPANIAAPGRDIVPIVRFNFNANGVAVLTNVPGSLTTKDKGQAEDAPVILPTFAELDEEPKALNQPIPEVTPGLRERVGRGTATVKFFVDVDGKVRVPVVLDFTAPEVARAALAAVEQWRFEPPRQSGRPTIAVETKTFHVGAPH